MSAVTLPIVGQLIDQGRVVSIPLDVVSGLMLVLQVSVFLHSWIGDVQVCDGSYDMHMVLYSFVLM